jgi:hypothetical protein
MKKKIDYKASFTIWLRATDTNDALGTLDAMAYDLEKFYDNRGVEIKVNNPKITKR